MSTTKRKPWLAQPARLRVAEEKMRRATEHEAWRDALHAPMTIGWMVAPPEHCKEDPMTPKTAPRGRLSRPARIADLEEATRELAVEYQASSLPKARFAEAGTAFGTVRSDALPENLAEAEIADKLSETIEHLEEIAEGFSAIDPPVIGAERPEKPGANP